MDKIDWEKRKLKNKMLNWVVFFRGQFNQSFRILGFLGGIFLFWR